MQKPRSPNVVPADDDIREFIEIDMREHRQCRDHADGLLQPARNGRQTESSSAADAAEGADQP
jgi:hypothetical protein